MSEPTQASIGAEIRRRRTEQGLTLDQLGERTGLSPNHIGNVENGHIDTGLPLLKRIADGLGIIVAELFGPVPTFTPKALTAARLFDKASPGVQAGLLAVLRGIVAEGREE